MIELTLIETRTVWGDPEECDDYEQEHDMLDRDEWSPGLLRDYLIRAQQNGISQASSSRVEPRSWWYSHVETDYHSGDDIERTFHIEGCTLATKRRIHRLLQAAR